MSDFLYTNNDLHDGVKYPASYTEIMSMDTIPDRDPWSYICEFKESTHFWMSEMKKSYSTRKLIPFAKITYSDDIACFDGENTSGNAKGYYVHTFSSAGLEARGYSDNFDE